MGKAPAFQFYPNDWCRDLDEHPLEIEGAWIRICCKMHWTGEGKLTKTREQWSRILRTNLEKSDQIIDYLINEGICDSSVTDNGKVTLISRRMFREQKDKKNAALRQAKYRQSQKNNRKITPPSSIPSSSSSPRTKQTKAKKATQWPKNFVLKDTMKQYAVNNQIDPKKVGEFFEEFRDWAESKGAKYVDWEAAFRNRVRRAPEFSPQFIKKKAKEKPEWRQ